MADKVEVTRNGISGCTIIFITFLLLKVFGVVTWSWWLVTLPLWGGLALVLAILVVIGIVIAICALIAKLLD